MQTMPFDPGAGSNSRGRTAFTLIELLVVIAIIAILAAILFPVFAKAREKARQTSCLSNLKQMGNAVAMYTQDFDETLPLGYSSGCDASHPEICAIRTWMHKVQPYAKNTQLWVCPSASNFKPSANIASGGTTGGYGCNLNLMGSAKARALAELATPASTFIVAEAAQLKDGAPAADPAKWNDYVSGSTDWQVVPPSRFRNTDESASGWYGYTNNYSQPYGSYGDWYRRPVPRHSEGLSILYADGHVKWSKIEQFTGVNAGRPAGWPYGDANNTWDDQ